MTEPLTDLQAALRKACEDAAKYLPEPRGISDADVADIIERHLTPVFDALRDSVIEECAEIARPVDDVLAGVILKLKGAPRELLPLIHSHMQALVERREDALIRECNDAWIQEIGPYLHVPYGFDLNCILKGVRERLASLSKPAPVERSNENG